MKNIEYCLEGEKNVRLYLKLCIMTANKFSEVLKTSDLQEDEVCINLGYLLLKIPTQLSKTKLQRLLS